MGVEATYRFSNWHLLLGKLFLLVRRKRGRPKLDARITEEYAPSRRQALNKM